MENLRIRGRSSGFRCKKCNSNERYIKNKGIHKGIYCKGCGSWIKWLPKSAKDYVIWFGKYKGKNIEDIYLGDLRDYYRYMREVDLSESKKKCLDKIRVYLDIMNVYYG